jgi:hypothetical protein
MSLAGAAIGFAVGGPVGAAIGGAIGGVGRAHEITINGETYNLDPEPPAEHQTPDDPEKPAGGV